MTTIIQADLRGANGRPVELLFDGDRRSGPALLTLPGGQAIEVFVTEVDVVSDRVRVLADGRGAVEPSQRRVQLHLTVQATVTMAYGGDERPRQSAARPLLPLPLVAEAPRPRKVQKQRKAKAEDAPTQIAPGPSRWVPRQLVSVVPADCARDERDDW